MERLAEIFRELESMGAANINLVSPTPYAVHIAEAMGTPGPEDSAFPSSITPTDMIRRRPLACLTALSTSIYRT